MAVVNIITTICDCTDLLEVLHVCVKCITSYLWMLEVLDCLKSDRTVLEIIPGPQILRILGSFKTCLAYISFQIFSSFELVLLDLGVPFLLLKYNG